MRIVVAATGLTVGLLVVAAATLGPLPLDRNYRGAIARLLAALHRNGAPSWIAYSTLESASNVLMFVPVGLFGALLVTGRWRWLVVAGVPLLSGAIEIWQGLALPQRFSSLGDVAANSIGGWIGVALAAGCVWVVHQRDRRLRERWESEMQTRFSGRKPG